MSGATGAVETEIYMAGTQTEGTPRSAAIVASPSEVVLRGLVDLLREAGDVVVAGTATDDAMLLGLLRERTPDLLVVDVALIDGLRDGLGATRPPRMLVFGPQRHVGTCARFDGRIACGYFHLGELPGRIVSSIAVVARCDQERAGAAACAHCPAQRTLQPPRLPLTRREYDVFLRIGWMQGNIEISDGLDISVKTVESYRESIKRKLGLSSAAALLEAAVSWRSGGLAMRADGEHLRDGGECRRNPRPRTGFAALV